jgi:isopentenyl-diphosphate Delta-isomerase
MELQRVILVNEKDEPLGIMEKMEAHKKAVLHRAFSVFVFNNKGEMLLQQRALKKYHSPGLWSNACCSHPQPGEETIMAAERRVQEELGIQIPIQKQFHFIYKAQFENGLTEHEFDHVFTGIYNFTPQINKDEVKDTCYKSMNDIKQSIQSHPQKYTEWFKIAFPEIEKWWMKNFIPAAHE